METNIKIIMDNLSGHLETFDEILRAGHSIYEHYPTDLIVDHDASTQAHCTFRHILACAHASFSDIPDVHHLYIRGQNLWHLERANCVIRFKKTDEDGVSTNYPTIQARNFDKGLPIPGLPPEPTRLNIGYLLDDTGLGFVRSQVALPVGRSTMWCAAIISQADREEGEQVWRDVTRQPRF